MRPTAEAVGETAGLALLWVAATGTTTLGNFAVGACLGYGALALAERVPGAGSVLRRVRLSVGLLLYFLWELVMSNLRVAYEVMSPRYRISPGVVGITLDARTDVEIALLANLITLTPGTMSLDVSEDRRVLYVHSMYIDDRDEFERSIKEGFERRVLEVLR
jgi:multicomponent Na+:H+ antiporter subunit E